MPSAQSTKKGLGVLRTTNNFGRPLPRFGHKLSVFLLFPLSGPLTHSSVNVPNARSRTVAPADYSLSFFGTAFTYIYIYIYKYIYIYIYITTDGSLVLHATQVCAPVRATEPRISRTRTAPVAPPRSRITAATEPAMSV